MIQTLDPSHVKVMLATHHVGRLACSDDGVPYIVPVTYTYRDGAIYWHTNEGRKLSILRKNPHVCFEVDEIVSITRWRSALASGTAEELSGPEADDSLKILSDSIGAMVSSALADGIDPDYREEICRRIRLGVQRGAVFRLRPRETSGRYETDPLPSLW